MVAEGLPEVWCDRCDRPSVRVVRTQSGNHTLCERHAASLEYRITSTAWVPRPKATR